MSKEKALLNLYKKLNSLQIDYSLVNTSLHSVNPWSTKYITLSNQQDDIWNQIRELQKEISKLENK